MPPPPPPPPGITDAEAEIIAEANSIINDANRSNAKGSFERRLLETRTRVAQNVAQTCSK